MSEESKFDDPIWEYTLYTKLTPYIDAVREFWNQIEEIEITGTGVFSLEKSNLKFTSEIPPGLMYRMTNTPVRSPIKNVQVFPFVPVSYLQIVGVSGGASRMVSRVCSNNSFKIEEFTIIEKNNLPSTYHQGQFVAFIPTKVLESSQLMGKWTYITLNEMIALLQDNVPQSVKYKIQKYIIVN